MIILTSIASFLAGVATVLATEGHYIGALTFGISAIPFALGALFWWFMDQPPKQSDRQQIRHVANPLNIPPSQIDHANH